jgi:hypothetical protein
VLAPATPLLFPTKLSQSDTVLSCTVARGERQKARSSTADQSQADISTATQRLILTSSTRAGLSELAGARNTSRPGLTSQDDGTSHMPCHTAARSSSGTAARRARMSQAVVMRGRGDQEVRKEIVQLRVPTQASRFPAVACEWHDVRETVERCRESQWWIRRGDRVCCWALVSDAAKLRIRFTWAEGDE